MPYIINNEIGSAKVTTIELWPYNSLKPKGFVVFLMAVLGLVIGSPAGSHPSVCCLLETTAGSALAL